jgi:hypothetical protein
MVYLLYAGHSLGKYKLLPEIAWPDSSWFFSPELARKSTRQLATVAYGLAALGFAISGIGLLAFQAWFRPALAITVIYESGTILLFWNGQWGHFVDHGGIGIFINLGALAVTLFM